MGDNTIIFTCPSTNDNFKSSEHKRNDRGLTKKQIYALAATGKLNSNGRTHYASQNTFGTNSNVHNLQKVPNTNILLLNINNKCS
jgi:hypothetical protein